MKGTVLITGATSGIGYALAKKFAREGYRLILVSSNEEHLRHTKNNLQKVKKGCVTATICRDLSEPKAADCLFDALEKKHCHVDILVNNAGFGMVGEAAEYENEKVERMLTLNMQTLTVLTDRFLRFSCKRKSGKVLNVASVGAFFPGPYTAAYYATKAYVASYSRAVRQEAARYGVQVCTLYPGTTRTEFFVKAGIRTPRFSMSPDRVAKEAYDGLMKNKEMIIPGAVNKALRFLPDPVEIKGVALIKRGKDLLK